MQGNFVDSEKHSQAKIRIARRRVEHDAYKSLPVGLLVFQYRPVARFWLLDGNPAAKRLTGIDARRWRGTDLGDIWPEAKRRGYCEILAVMVRGDARAPTAELRCRDERTQRDLAIRAFAMHGSRLGTMITDASTASPTASPGTSRVRCAGGGRCLFDDGMPGDGSPLMNFVQTVHDLRVPLLNVEGFSHDVRELVERISRQLQTSSPDDLRHARDLLDHDVSDLLGYVSQGVARLRELTDGLASLAGKGGETLTPIVLDMKELAKDVVALQAHTIRQRGVRVEVLDLPPAVGDRSAVNRVLSNLLINAIQALVPERPGIVVIGHDGREGDRQRYYVRDNGVGLEPQHYEVIFETFCRLRPESAAGCGVGLAAVKRIVEAHGGRVSVDSAPGAGSTFTFTLQAPPAPQT